MKALLYVLAGLGVWTAISVIVAPLIGRMMRHLDDPELVARLRQLNADTPPPAEAYVHAELDRIEAQADYFRRQMKGIDR